MRNLSLLASVAILMKPVAGFRLIPVRQAGWRGLRSSHMRHQHVDLVQVCQEVVASQPTVLVLAGGDRRIFSNWQGTQMNLDASLSSPCMLPFVDRLETVTSMTLAIMSNLVRAVDIQAGSVVDEKMLRLVGSGALFGAGKTTIGSVLGQCVQRILGNDTKLVRVNTEVKTDRSAYHIWIVDVCRPSSMVGLRTMIRKDMSFQELIEATECYLSERKMVLFLHLDEFAPFNEAGCIANTPEAFNTCWQGMLLPILRSPSIGLYISGRTAYYDSIASGKYGQPPTLALSEQLDLFSPKAIHTMLDKISIPLDTISNNDTVTLSQALDQLFCTKPGQMLQQQGSWEIAQRLHDVTGGVPRFVEYALHALLVHSEIYSALFERDGSVPCDALLHNLFNRGGDVYEAVRKATEIHFGSIGAAHADKKDLAQRVVGLVQLVLLAERTFRLSLQDIEDITHATFSFTTSPIAQLISHAQFWGIHRNINKSEGLISFAVPSAVLDGLAYVLYDLNTFFPNLRDENQDRGPSGKKSQQKATIVLAFHRHLASLMRHSNWLGLEEDSKDPITLLDTPAVGIAPSAPRAWDLPCLPVVHLCGRLQDIDAVRNSITYGGSKVDSAMDMEYEYGLLEGPDMPQRKGKGKGKLRMKPKAKMDATKSQCHPTLLGEFLTSLSSTEYHAFTTGERSSSADLLVRYGTDVTHLQVKAIGPLTTQTILEDSGKAALTVKASPGLQHTLAFVIPRQDVRAAAVTSFGPLSCEHLAAHLEDALVHLKEPDPDNKLDVMERKNMRLAADLVKEGKLKVVILDEAQYTRFSRYRELAKALAVGPQWQGP